MTFTGVIRTDETGRVWRECETMDINNQGKTITVRRLSDLEAKALISAEYGFEMGSIWIQAPCWYEATDMNYFRFSVKSWQYEARNYEALQTIFD